ncbi:uncharacterized protein LOC125490807 [Plutella xylostella]|uniref:uncharacterized protein LOC125490807 n=1 Tax=Plutella xylostella TaxID=51655 RepID=UPI0005D0A563|nr:uncharacterized protein LOC125490807 [Plutella xylostella]
MPRVRKAKPTRQPEREMVPQGQERDGRVAPSTNRMVYMKSLLRRTVGVLSSRIGKLEESLNNTAFTINPNVSAQSTSTLQTRTDNDGHRPQLVMPQQLDKPKFPGKHGIHPATFLEDLGSYLRKVQGITFEPELIVECLGGDVRNWARIYLERWNSFEDFKRDFLETYWGEAEQSLLRRSIVSNCWDSTKGSMLSHFLHLSGQAKMLTYPMNETQMVNDIIQHYPKEVQYAWAVSNKSGTLEACEFLRKLDDVHRQERNKRRPNPVPELRPRVWNRNFNQGKARNGPVVDRNPDARAINELEQMEPLPAIPEGTNFVESASNLN